MDRKIVPRSKLASLLRRRGRKRVVFTNGCFDLVHAGHVRLLERAKRLGDLLVVGLNSDGSLRRLKGPGRPLVGERHRAQVLAALGCVDYVTVFPEPTPLETIRALRPNVLIKGADYPVSQIVGRSDVKRVVRFPLVRGLSTSRLIEKIVHAYGPRRER